MHAKKDTQHGDENCTSGSVCVSVDGTRIGVVMWERKNSST